MKTTKLLPGILLCILMNISFFPLSLVSQKSRYMPLYEYAITGDIDTARKLLRQGADADKPDTQEGLTPLMHAARSSQAGVNMLRLLVEYGADVNAADSPPPPPSMDWMQNLPEELKKQMPDMDNEALTPKPKPVLYYAMEGADRAKIEYLVAAGADLHYQYSSGYDILIDAAYKLRDHNRYDMMKWLIGKGVRVDGLTKYGESALSVASLRGYFDIVRLLLESDADAEQLRWTPPMHAAVFGKAQDVRAMLQKRPYTGERERFGRTAFLLAIQAGRLDNARVLLEKGASANESGAQGKTALMYAAAASQTELVAWLLKEGASVNTTDDYGRTALMEACESGAEEAVGPLLKAGADLSKKNDFGETAAKMVRSPKLFRLLIAHGADWNEADTELKRALAGLPADQRLLISRQYYQAGKKRRFGKHNPDVMAVPFWEAMVKSGVSAGAARIQFDDNDYGMPGSGNAVWSYDRFGKSINVLPDGRIIEIAGEHEDSYDSDFCIYNDVIIFDGNGDFNIYGYPKEVFPPTDFHTATLVGDDIYIVGSLGYMGERRYGETPVYRLNIKTFNIQQVDTGGENPGWIHDHRASLLNGDQIRISGGKVCEQMDGREQIRENEGEFILDLETMMWSQVGE